MVQIRNSASAAQYSCTSRSRKTTDAFQTPITRERRGLQWSKRCLRSCQSQGNTRMPIVQ
jgi:hypothetical protein